MKPQRITFGRMYPNAGYTAKYRREIRRMIKAMHEDTKREIQALYADGVQDAKKPKTLTEVMAMLRKKWYKIFEQRSREINRWMAESVKKRTRKDIIKQLTAIGLAITPNFTDSEKKIISDIVQTGVELIKTIPRDYLGNVQETVKNAVQNAVERGGDRHAIYETIKDKFDHPLVQTQKQAERRAELISADQVQKVTQDFARENAKAYGATKAVWIHIPGEKTSRITHIEMDDHEFDIDVGLYDPDVGREVKPGELIYCRCAQSFIFPGTE